MHILYKSGTTRWVFQPKFKNRAFLGRSWCFPYQ